MSDGAGRLLDRFSDKAQNPLLFPLGTEEGLRQTLHPAVSCVAGADGLFRFFLDFLTQQAQAPRVPPSMDSRGALFFSFLKQRLVLEQTFLKNSAFPSAHGSRRSIRRRPVRIADPCVARATHWRMGPGMKDIQ